MIIVFTPCLEVIFNSYNECKQKRDELYNYYNKKAMNSTKRERSNIVSFN